MSEEMDFTPDLITLEDEEGQEHEFEIVDAIEYNDTRYMALIPIFDQPEEVLEDDGELVILKVTDKDGEEFLEPIEDDDLYNEIADIFIDRLDDLYEITE